MPAPLPPLPQTDDPPHSFLFSNEEIAEITDEERRHGRYTLARLPAQKRQSIVVLLKERRPLRDIARLVSVAFETVQAVAQAHAGELDKHYSDFGKQLRRINHYMADRLERNVESFPIQSIPLAIKLIGEYGELIEGRATARIEHREGPRVSNLEQYEQIIGNLEKKIAGRIIEPGSEIHLDGGKPALMDTPGLAAAGPDDGLAIDSESDVGEAVTQGNGELANLCSYPLTDETRANSSPGTPGGGIKDTAGGVAPSLRGFLASVVSHNSAKPPPKDVPPVTDNSLRRGSKASAATGAGPLWSS